MADEEKAPPAGEGEKALDQVEGDGEAKKASFIQKLLGNKIVMMGGTAVLGVGLGVGVMSFMGGGKKENKKAHAKAEAPQEKEGGHDKKEDHGAKEEPKEEPKEETKEEASEAAEVKDEAKGEEGAKEPTETAEEGGGEGGGAEPIYFKFEPVVVNVVEKNSLHYLKLQMVTEVTSNEVIEEMKIKTPELRDELLFLINDMTLREILSSGGKALLKEDIKSTFNKGLKKGQVKKIYLTDFTVQ